MQLKIVGLTIQSEIMLSVPNQLALAHFVNTSKLKQKLWNEQQKHFFRSKQIVRDKQRPLFRNSHNHTTHQKWTRWLKNISFENAYDGYQPTAKSWATGKKINLQRWKDLYMMALECQVEGNILTSTWCRYMEVFLRPQTTCWTHQT